MSWTYTQNILRARSPGVSLFRGQARGLQKSRSAPSVAEARRTQGAEKARQAEGKQRRGEASRSEADAKRRGEAEAKQAEGKRRQKRSERSRSKQNASKSQARKRIAEATQAGRMLHRGGQISRGKRKASDATPAEGKQEQGMQYKEAAKTLTSPSNRPAD